MTKKKKIILVTTKGCEGCNIMHNLIIKALTNHGIKDWKFDVYDKDEVKDLVKEFDITDFPTTLFFEDFEFKSKLIGTKPINQIINTINGD